jgi:hypothetical protein
MSNNPEINYFSDLTWLQGKAAFCENEEQLAFHIVNHTIKIVPYAQALLWREGAFGIEVMAVSGVSVINHSSPYISFLEKKLIPKILKEHDDVTKINMEQYADLIASYGGFIFPLCLSLPFSTGSNKQLKIKSGLILFSKTDWNETEITKITNIVSYYKYLWDLFLKQSNFNINRLKRLRKLKWIFLGIILLLMLVPVRDSVLVPAEIAPKEPLVISPSISGLISEIYVKPNDYVEKNQKLFRLDTITLDNQYQQSIKNLDIVKEKYRKAYHHSYNAPESKSELRILESEIKIAEDEVNYTKSLLDRAVIRAEFAGTVIFSDPKYWLGHPVEVGERVMLLADDNMKQLDIFIAVDDLIALPEKAKVVFYPNPRPLSTLKGEIIFISKQAEVQPDSILAYYTVATLDPEYANEYQFGIKGTAKLYGDRVILGYYLFRRPLSWLRRHLGV